MQLSSSREELHSSKSLFDITSQAFNQVIKEGLTLDHIFILEAFIEGTDLTKHISSVRVQACKQTLIRKEYLTETGNVTLLGRALIKSLKDNTSTSEIIRAVEIVTEVGFEAWWSAYPATDIFTAEGMTFEGTRALRTKKLDCKKEFDKVIKEGEYAPTDLIRALEYEVQLKKSVSIREKENKMKYMQNSLTYLKNRTFENFIEVSKTTIKRSNGDNMDI